MSVIRFTAPDQMVIRFGEVRTIQGGGSSLPAGSAAMDELAWDAANSTWAAAAGAEDIYAALTRTDDVADLIVALLDLLSTGGRARPAAPTSAWSAAYAARRFPGAFWRNAIDAVWAASPPYLWCLAPSRRGWAAGFDLEYRRRGTDGSYSPVAAEAPVDLPAAIHIDGVPYDARRATWPSAAAQPANVADHMAMTWRPAGRTAQVAAQP